MKSNNSTQANASSETLGALLQHARHQAGHTIKQLAAISSVPTSQIAKLEHDQVQKPNPAQLASLAESLGLDLTVLYRAAGYRTPSALSRLESELEQKLALLAPENLRRVERYVETLVREHELAPEPATEPDATTN